LAFCSDCGKQLRDDARFCRACGADQSAGLASDAAADSGVADDHATPETTSSSKVEAPPLEVGLPPADAVFPTTPAPPKSRRGLLLLVVAVVVALATMAGVMAFLLLRDRESGGVKGARPGEVFTIHRGGVTAGSGFWRGGPSIDGNIVVWAQEVGAPKSDKSHDHDIRGKNLSTGEEFDVCTDSGDQRDPIVAGGVVVWVDEGGGSGDIRAHDLESGKTFTVVEDSNSHGAALGGTQMCFDGRYVVWVGDVQGPGQAHSRIYFKPLRGGEAEPVSEPRFRLDDGSSWQIQPWISNSIVAWIEPGPDNASGQATTVVRAKDLSSGQESVPLAEHYASIMGVQQPYISQGKLVVFDSIQWKHSCIRIAAVPGDNEWRQLPGSQDLESTSPHISGDTAVWMMPGVGIVATDLESENTVLVAKVEADPEADRYLGEGLAVSGDTVVWVEGTTLRACVIDWDQPAVTPPPPSPTASIVVGY